MRAGEFGENRCELRSWPPWCVEFRKRNSGVSEDIVGFGGRANDDAGETFVAAEASGVLLRSALSVRKCERRDAGFAAPSPTRTAENAHRCSAESASSLGSKQRHRSTLEELRAASKGGSHGSRLQGSHREAREALCGEPVACSWSERGSFVFIRCREERRRHCAECRCRGPVTASDALTWVPSCEATASDAERVRRLRAWRGFNRARSRRGSTSSWVDGLLGANDK